MMVPQRNWSNAGPLYVSEMGARVVAGSGRPGDRHHFGKLLLQGLRDDPDFLLQINAETDGSETSGSVLDRSVRCAVALRRMGLRQGDVITMLALNNLNSCIPLYAALYTGIIMSPLDITSNARDLKSTFTRTKPKLIFCQTEKVAEMKEAIKDFDLQPQIISFDGESGSLGELLQSVEDEAVRDFKAEEIDPETCTALLIPTSGSTGLSKSAAVSHRNISISFPHFWIYSTQFPYPIERALVWGHLQAVTTLQMYLMSPIMRFTRVHSSAQNTEEHCIEVINKYKPTLALMYPTFWRCLLFRPHCDLSSFKIILLGSSAVANELVAETKERAPNATIRTGYGLTENNGTAFWDTSNKLAWTELPILQYRLVDIDTLEDITMPNVNGELWIKGPSTFQGYYNDPAATKDALTEDNWLRTGDIFYRDQDDHYHYVERFKMLLKYKRTNVYPLEVENVIRQHLGVLDVAVTGIPDPDVGDLVVACVVAKPGSSVTAQDIKDQVKGTLSTPKHLHGGVVFLDQLPVMPTGKVNRKILKQLVLTSKRQ